MNKNALIALVALAILALLGVWMFGRGSGPSEEIVPASDSTAATGMPVIPEGDHMMPDGAIMEDGVIMQDDSKMPVEEKIVTHEITITGRSFSFSPVNITVKKGETVRLTFKNSGGTHDWRLDEFNAHTKQLSSGQEETIEFIANKTGAFEYYCSVGTHRAMGMKGTLVVE